MTRLERFAQLADHPWLGRSYKKLSAAERFMIVNFLLETEKLDVREYVLRVNRLFLDRPKTPRWTTVLELLDALKSPS